MTKAISILLAWPLICLISIASTSSFVVLPQRSRLCTPCLHAKKKGKKNKQEQKKGGFEWAASFTIQPYDAKDARQLASTAMASYKGRAQEHLCKEIEEAADIPKALWRAPVACVIVGEADSGNEGESGATIVQYANIAALETIGLQPTEFEKLFSTAPPKVDGEPLAFPISLVLPPVMKGGKKFERGYTKKLLKQESGDITILDANRWDLERSQLVDGKFVTQSFGVAYSWSEWMVGETLLCQPGGIQEKVEEVEDYDELIVQQGAFIRDLKENQGFGNKDDQVVEAVAELLRLKKHQAEK